MAYNPIGALDVFSLPDLNPVDFDLVDYAYTAPLWSPSKGQLQLIGGSAAQPDARFIYVVDFDAGTSQQFPLPGASATQDARWSDHGRYLMTFNRGDAGTILLIDASSGAQSTLSEPGFILTPVDWSYDDSWLLYTAQISAASPVDLFAYDVAAGQSHPIQDLNNTPLTGQWADDSDQLLMIAQSIGQSYGLFTLAGPAFDTWQPLVPSVESQIVQSSIRWQGNTIVLEYGGTLLSLDTTTHAVARISPQSVQVVSGSMRLME